MKRRVTFLALLLAVVLAAPAAAAPIIVTVGDNDGYGAGIVDNGNLGTFANANTDNRSVAEATAVNGAQITDLYSAIHPGWGANTSTTASVILPFAGTLSSGTLTIDMGDFQAAAFGAILANVNGVPLSMNFEDGFTNSVVRSFILSGAQLAAANLAGAVILNLDRNSSGDFIAFDYFELTGVTDAAVPEPSLLLLTGLGLAAAVRRRLA